MKKKLLIIFLSIVSAFCLVFGLAACDNNAGNGGGNGESGVNGGSNGANENGGEEVWGNVYNLTAAYAKATELGYTGSLEDFIEMISGKDGSQGDDGLSAYDIWLKNGHTGSESDFLEWLKGDKGDDGDEGGQGLSAFEIYVKYHPEYDGTEEEWIESLKGTASGEAVSVKDAYIDADGNLFIVLTNGEEIDCGKVRDDRPTENLQYSAIKKDGQIEGYKVIGLGNVSDMDIVIPSVYNGKPVLDINFYASSRVNEITSVVIPDSITSIGDNAFRDCTGLLSVTIPDSVETIEGWAFSDCISLESVTIPDSVKTIGEYAFYECKSLVSVEIPDSVESIGIGAFYWCESLESVEIPDSVTTIASGAFQYCSSLKSVKIPGTVTEIEYVSFADCTSLESIVIPGSVETIGASAFGGCTELKNVTFENGLKTIGWSAFGGCALESIEIPESVESIVVGAFSACYNLASITVAKNNPVYSSAGNCLIETESKTLIEGSNNSIIPADGSVTSILYGAFSGRTALESIIIPHCIKGIGMCAFLDCDNISVYYCGTEEEWQEIGGLGSNAEIYGQVYFYSEEQPTEEGNFWHYVDDEVVVWQQTCVDGEES